MLTNKATDFVQFTGVKPIIRCELRGVKAEFGFVLPCLNVDVGRFIGFVAEKVKPIATDAEDGWHPRPRECYRRHSMPACQPWKKSVRLSTPVSRKASWASETPSSQSTW